MAAIATELRALMELTRVRVNEDTLRVDADRAGDQDDDAVLSPEYAYSTIATHVRVLYEELKDVQRSKPLADARRKTPLTGKFDSFRLRALQRYVLDTGGAGLSVNEQAKLFEFLDVWDRTKEGMPQDAGHYQLLREAFPDVGAFRHALEDDIDKAVNEAGWKRVTLVELDQPYEAYFRSALGVTRALLKAAGDNVRWWSGESGPAPPDDRRETPFDGDAFKLCEREVIAKYGENSAIIALHVFSDASQLSWSGGTCPGPTSGSGPSYLRVVVIRIYILLCS